MTKNDTMNKSTAYDYLGTAEEQRWDRWFRRVEDEFCPLMMPFAGQPILYVEIGCWAGASAEWVCRNVLTHPESRGVGIDPYLPERRHPKEEIDRIVRRATARVKATGVMWKWMELESVRALASVGNMIGGFGQPIDIFYVDGCHDAGAVVTDFALAWPMLRDGALVIFDDYVTAKAKSTPNVREGVEAIKLAWGPWLEPAAPERSRRQRAFWIRKGAR